MQVGNLLAYDSVGQTTHRLDGEYADAVVSARRARTTGAGLIFFCRRESRRGEPFVIPATSLKSTPAMIFRVPTRAYTCAHAPPPADRYFPFRYAAWNR